LLDQQYWDVVSRSTVSYPALAHHHVKLSKRRRGSKSLSPDVHFQVLQECMCLRVGEKEEGMERKGEIT